MPAKQRTKPRVAAGTITPVELGGAPVPEDDVIHVFTYQGQEYYMPRYIAPAFGLEALDMFRKQGDAMTLSWLLENVLGPDAYSVLIHAKDVTKEQISAVALIVQNHVLSAVESEGN